MSLKRYNLDLAFQEPVSPAVQGLLMAMEATIRKAKPFAVVINAGQPNEEMTVVAQWHRCRHDTNEKCEAELEV